MFSDRKKTFLSFASLLCINSAMTAGEISQEKPITAETENVLSNTDTLNDTEAKQFSDSMHKLMAYTKNIVNQLAKTVEKRGSKSLPNAPEIIAQLGTFSNDLDNALNTLWQAASTDQITFLEKIVATLEVCHNALSCIQNVITTNFRISPNADCLAPTKRVHLDHTIDEFRHDIATLEAELETTATAIHAASDLIGLTTSERLSRTIHNCLVEPFFKYKLDFWLPAAGLTTLGAIYLYWQHFCPRSGGIFIPDFDPKTKAPITKQVTIQTDEGGAQVVTAPKGKILYGQDACYHIYENTEKYNVLTRWIGGRLIGPAPEIRMSGLPHLHPQDRHKISSTLLFFRSIFGASDPIAGGIVGYMGYSMLPKVREIKEGLHLKITSSWNKARGGTYVDLPIAGNYIKHPRYTMRDVIGLSKIKERLREVIEYAINPALFRNSGKIPCCNYILHGLTRAGKSHTVECAAGEIIANSTLPFCYISMPVTALKEFGVPLVIGFIKEHAPCIAFIDEFDLVGPNRVDSKELVEQLLRELGQGETLSNDPYKPIILFTACNKLEGIDEALRTLGRFGIEIPFKYPEPVDRMEFIAQYLTKNTLNTTKFDIMRLVQKTRNQPYEKIEFCLKHGINKCLKTGTVTQLALEEAIDETLYGLHYRILPHQALHPEMVQLLAVHFAGRALALLLTDGIETLDIVTINSYDMKIHEDAWGEGKSGKQSEQKKTDYGCALTRGLADETYNFISPAALHADIMQLVAGAVAEEVLLGACTNTCHADNIAYAFNKASTLASRGLYQYQIATLSDDQRAEISNAALKKMEQCKSEVRVLLEKHKNALIATAECLQLLGTLDDRIVRNIVENPQGAFIALTLTEAEFKNATEDAALFGIIENLNLMLRNKEALHELLQQHIAAQKASTEQKPESVVVAPA
jgi:ATP-dependent Zn protease